MVKIIINTVRSAFSRYVQHLKKHCIFLSTIRNWQCSFVYKRLLYTIGGGGQRAGGWVANLMPARPGLVTEMNEMGSVRIKFLICFEN